MAGTCRLALRLRGFFLPPPEGTERSKAPSSSSSSKDEEGEEGMKGDSDPTGSASEDGAGAGGLALWPFWVSV